MGGMPKPSPLPAELLGRAFRVAEARDRGVGGSRMRRADLVRPVHGVRVPAGTDVDRVRALALVLGPRRRFSHTTAAALWGAPLPSAASTDAGIHVASLDGAALVRRPGVVAHRTTDPKVSRVDGLPTSTPARTWAECATVLGHRELVVLGDHLVGRSGLASPEDLGRAIRPRGHGAVAARAALELVRVGSESRMETLLRLGVVDAGFPEPELNMDVYDERGAFLGRVDMCWPALRIALEYDGDHHRERDVFRYDQRRANGFTVNGWIVIHATASDAAQPAVLYERLRQAFAARMR